MEGLRNFGGGGLNTPKPPSPRYATAYRYINVFKRTCHFLSQMDTVHHLPSYSFQIHFNNTLRSLHRLLHGLFPSNSSTKTLEVFPFSSMHSTCSAHLILLHLFILMIFSKVLIIQFFTPPVSSTWVQKSLSAP